MEIGSRIKEVRENKKITRKQLALKLGVSDVTITRYENGTRKPNIKVLTEIANILEVPLEGLIGVKLYSDDEVLRSEYETVKAINILINKLGYKVVDLTKEQYEDLEKSTLEFLGYKLSTLIKSEV